MNERIKQIAFEAGQGGHSWYNDPNCIQAFAELIVRECADLVMNDENAFDVLKHFGIEE